MSTRLNAVPLWVNHFRGESALIFPSFQGVSGSLTLSCTTITLGLSFRYWGCSTAERPKVRGSRFRIRNIRKRLEVVDESMVDTQSIGPRGPLRIDADGMRRGRQACTGSANTIE